MCTKLHNALRSAEVAEGVATEGKEALLAEAYLAFERAGSGDTNDARVYVIPHLCGRERCSKLIFHNGAKRRHHDTLRRAQTRFILFKQGAYFDRAFVHFVPLISASADKTWHWLLLGLIENTTGTPPAERKKTALRGARPSLTVFFCSAGGVLKHTLARNVSLVTDSSASQDTGATSLPHPPSPSAVRRRQSAVARCRRQTTEAGR